MRPTTPRRMAPSMHVYDVHQQLLGYVVEKRPHSFLLLQRLACEQLIEVPAPCVAAVVGNLVLLTVTPGELELLGRVVERAEQPHLFRAVGPQRALVPA